jgi:hypothetical protein
MNNILEVLPAGRHGHRLRRWLFVSAHKHFVRLIDGE